jgi:replicative DNA helicase
MNPITDLEMENILKKIENAIGKDTISEQETWLRIKQLCTHELQSLLPNAPLKNLAQLAEEFFAGKTLQNCMPTGFLPLDNAIGGFSEGEFVVVGGRPAMGKTLFLLQIALNMSKTVPVMYISHDLSDYLLICRILSNLSGIDSQKIANNQFTEQEKSQLELAQKELSNYQLTINAEVEKSIDVLVEYSIQQIKNQGVKVICIDYLQLLTYHRYRRYNRDAEVDEICKKLKSLAKEHKVCVIAASALNRGIEGRAGLDGKRPQLSDLRESGGIEQMANKVLLLHRTEYYRIIEDCAGNSLLGIMEVIIAKNTAGMTGDIRLKFSAEYGRITTFEKDTESVSDNFINKIRELGMEMGMNSEVPF